MEGARGAQPRGTGGGWRIIGVVGGLVFALIGVALMFYVADVGGDPVCGPATPPDEACFETSTRKTIDLATAWSAGILGFVVLPLGIYFAATGRGARLVVGTAAASLVVLALGALLTSG